MTSGRTEWMEYQLRELPHQDYRRQLQGLPISWRALLITTIEEVTHESVAATLKEREPTQGETNMTTGPNQLSLKMDGAQASHPHPVVAARVRARPWRVGGCGGPIAVQPAAWAQVERPPVQILVVYCLVVFRNTKVDPLHNNLQICYLPIVLNFVTFNNSHFNVYAEHAFVLIKDTQKRITVQVRLCSISVLVSIVIF